MDLHPGSNIYLTSWFILSVLFLTRGETPWYLYVSVIPRDMDLQPDSNIYLTS